MAQERRNDQAMELRTEKHPHMRPALVLDGRAGAGMSMSLLMDVGNQKRGDEYVTHTLVTQWRCLDLVESSIRASLVGGIVNGLLLDFRLDISLGLDYQASARQRASQKSYEPVVARAFPLIFFFLGEGDAPSTSCFLGPRLRGVFLTGDSLPS